MKKQMKIQNALQILAMVTVVTQAVACTKTDETKVASRLTQVEARKNSTVPQADSTPEGVQEETAKTQTAVPAPDHIPGYNTEGNAFTGTLQVRSDDKKVVQNSQCSLELVSVDDKNWAVLNIGGHEVRIIVNKEWVQKDKQGFSNEALKTQSDKGAFTLTLNKTTEMTYNVVLDESQRIKILRETLLVNEESLGDKNLSEFITAGRKKLIEDSQYTDVKMISDGVYVVLNDKNQFSAFSYFRQELIPGSGTEKSAANGEKELSGSYSNALVATCVGLKAEKK